MALQKVVQISGESVLRTDFGFVSNGEKTIDVPMYIKVQSVQGDKSNVTALVVYSSEKCTFQKTFSVPVSVESDASNFIKQAYEHLKTLPEFAGAANC
jgi:hypothetical protein